MACWTHFSHTHQPAFSHSDAMVLWPRYSTSNFVKSIVSHSVSILVESLPLSVVVCALHCFSREQSVHVHGRSLHAC